MKRFLLLLALLSPSLIFAAAQYPEKLRIDGKEESLMATPLEDFWSTARPRPDTLTQTSWACWRGYVGTWEIIDNKLCLLQLARTEIKPKDDSFEEASITLPLKSFFGTDGPVLAEWFSGVLRVARGQVLAQVNTGYASVYEEDLFLIIDHGNVTSRRLVKNSKASITSESDLAWREFGRINANGAITAMLPEENLTLEKGRWLGQSEFNERKDELLKNKTCFEIRGLYMPGMLLFPNQSDAANSIPIEIPEPQVLPESGVAVEATCTLAMTESGLRLIVSELIELPAGFAVQRSTPAAKTPNLQVSANQIVDAPSPSKVVQQL
jgi:hypothetical protein